MSRAERLQAHAVSESWIPSPEAHLKSPRDAFHYWWTLDALGYDSDRGMNDEKILDVGAYDGWLDFLLIKNGYQVEGVELIPELCKSARMYAQTHNIKYQIHQGFFEDIQIDRRFDVAICYEVLEHIPLDMVPAYVAKMEAIAESIHISLPDQRHQDNPQHLWTPTFDLIRSMWGAKSHFLLTYKPYPGTEIPANFMISWSLD